LKQIQINRSKHCKLVFHYWKIDFLWVQKIESKIFSSNNKILPELTCQVFSNFTDNVQMIKQKSNSNFFIKIIIEFWKCNVSGIEFLDCYLKWSSIEKKYHKHFEEMNFEIDWKLKTLK
jgi:hypothetical protein